MPLERPPPRAFLAEASSARPLSRKRRRRRRWLPPAFRVRVDASAMPCNGTDIMPRVVRVRGCVLVVSLSSQWACLRGGPASRGLNPRLQYRHRSSCATCRTGLPAQPDQLVAIKQLEAIRDAYQAAPGNLRSRFQHLFLNVVDNPASRVKPDGKAPWAASCTQQQNLVPSLPATWFSSFCRPLCTPAPVSHLPVATQRSSCMSKVGGLSGVDELQWREALQRAGGEGNAKNLWPVLALGTRDLLARKHAQVQLMADLRVV